MMLSLNLVFNSNKCVHAHLGHAFGHLEGENEGHRKAGLARSAPGSRQERQAVPGVQRS